MNEDITVAIHLHGVVELHEAWSLVEILQWAWHYTMLYQICNVFCIVELLLNKDG